MMTGLTGTPGTGKSTLAQELRRRGHQVVHLADTIQPYVLGRDEVRDTVVVDEERWSGEFPVIDGIVEGHFAHYLPCDRIIILRCRPDVLACRLKERGYPSEKIQENVEAEALDIILQETVERFSDDQIYEIDSTEAEIRTLADRVELILKGNCPPSYGEIDWSGYFLEGL
jgi:adenylate kinase